jgi:EAL domain-containing protein (putative c-di-GMP-specific phosphodiesterase class I)
LPGPVNTRRGSTLEETGLIVPVGLWVLRQASQQVAKWSRDSGQALSLAVNISSRQLHQPELADQIASALAEAGLEPQQLEIELTESMLVENSESVLRVVAEGVESLEQAAFLREQGCDDVQGCLLSKPMPAAAFPVWLVQHASGAGLELLTTH